MIKQANDSSSPRPSNWLANGVMTDLLTAFPKLDAIFAINDPTGIGRDLAAKQAQRKDFFIVGVDGSPDGATTLKSKGSLFEATPAQDPYQLRRLFSPSW